MGKYYARGGLWVALSLVMGACRGETSPQIPASAHLGIASNEVVELMGRPFLVTEVDRVVASPFGQQAETRYQALAVSGDGRRFSFDLTNGPRQLLVQTDAIRYGAHLFEVTAAPGVYILDGDTLSLTEGRRTIHVFQDGEYIGTEAL